MSARERIADRLWWSVPSSDDADAKAKASAMLDAFRAEVLNEAANGLAALGLVDSLVSGPQAWTEAIETLRRMATAGQAPAPYDHGTGGSPCADCGHDWFMHRHEDGTCRVCSCERYGRPASAPQSETAQGAELTETERAMLRYALDLAQDQIYSRGNEFGTDDQAAVDSLRRMADTGAES